jgi:hypothetical protein
MTSPAYLRHLATTYAASSKPNARAAAERLREIAGELEALLAGTPDTTPPPSDLTRGTDTALARLRAAAATPAPTREELAELRESLRRG